jgi:tRNA-specific 2-thiouridylase
MNLSVNSSVSGKSIYVGLSGGVDSAVSAALLLRAGAKVTGVFIKGWYPPGMPCSWSEDRRDAMRVAAHLRIPFITLDASDEYKRGVIDYLLSEYKAGRTPNPDIMCNREVKFGAFYRFAKESGADGIATGHYAQVSNGMLQRGVDPDKDQSYFLWAVPKEALAYTVFPLGSMRKSEVRALARTYKLPNALKRDSQGICFLGNVSVEDFLAKEFGTRPGIAVDEEGNGLGTHDGALLYTLGQRISPEGALAGPWYVVAKDIAGNILTVSHERRRDSRAALALESTNWLAEPEGGAYTAQYRYHGPKIPGTLAGNSFVPDDPVPETAAAGQSLVIYDGEECIGGGIIA